VLTDFKVTVPRVGVVKVKAHSPEWAALQGQNALKVDENCYKSCWVAACYGKRVLKSERVRPFSGFGR
jgi:hypothetical protein